MKLKHGGYTGNWENYKEKIRKYIGWKSIKMVDYYDREISMHYDDSGIIAETGGEEISKEVVSNLLNIDGIDLDIGLQNRNQNTLQEFENGILIDDKLDIWNSVKDITKLKTINDLFGDFDKEKIVQLPTIRMTKAMSCFIRLIYGDHEAMLQEQNDNIANKTKKNHGHQVEIAVKNFVDDRFPEEELNNLMGHPHYINEESSEKKRNILYRLKKKYLFDNWDENELYDYCKVNKIKLNRKGNAWTWSDDTNESINTNEVLKPWYEENPIYNNYINAIKEIHNKASMYLSRKVQDAIKKANQVMKHHKINKSLHLLKFDKFRLKVNLETNPILNVEVNNEEIIEKEDSINFDELEDQEVIEKEDSINFDKEDEEMIIREDSLDFNEVNNNQSIPFEVISDDENDVQIILTDDELD
ncbi:hypothetical protein ABK040_013117 [Willaertia magna]